MRTPQGRGRPTLLPDSGPGGAGGGGGRHGGVCDGGGCGTGSRSGSGWSTAWAACTRCCRGWGSGSSDRGPATPRPTPRPRRPGKRGARRVPEDGRIAGGPGDRVGRRDEAGAAPATPGVGPARRGRGQAVQIGWKYTYVRGPRSADGTAVVGRRARRWPASGDLGRGAGHRRLGLGARGHTGTDMQAVDAPRVVQPPYAPELNPVERFFRELRRAVEGRVYPDLQAKQEARNRS